MSQKMVSSGISLHFSMTRRNMEIQTDSHISQELWDKFIAYKHDDFVDEIEMRAIKEFKKFKQFATANYIIKK